MYCSQIQTSLTSRVLKKELHMLVLFTNTNVAHPSSFPEGAMHTCTVHTKTKKQKTKKNVAHLSSFDDFSIHACTVHRNKRGSSFVFSRGGYAHLYCPQKQTWLMRVTNMNSLLLGGMVGAPPQRALCLYTPRITQPCYLLQQRFRHASLQQQRVYVN